MESVIISLVNIVLYPFTSETFFVIIPGAFCVVECCFALIRRMMVGKF